MTTNCRIREFHEWDGHVSLIVLNKENESIQILDSQKENYSDEMCNEILKYGDQLCRRAFGQAAEFEPEFVNVVQQKNDSDCAPLFLMHVQNMCDDQAPILNLNVGDLRLSQVFALEHNRLDTWEIYTSPRKTPQPIREREPIIKKKLEKAKRNLTENLSEKK